jgi:hypothetical protein
MYIPDYLKEGKMNTIVNVPKPGRKFDPFD